MSLQDIEDGAIYGDVVAGLSPVMEPSSSSTTGAMDEEKKDGRVSDKSLEGI